jgi:acetoin:2,6-dichlorophenolindophenol oxidoreductase subunit alpha
MIRIRFFEERVSQLKIKGLIEGPVHTCIGQEAVSTGVCMALSKEDIIIGNHRSHGYLIAKGTDIRLLMSQVLKGDGASMHVNDAFVGAICSTAIVGSGLPLACGVAFASKMKKEDNVTCVFFGDGAVNEGVFYESINLSSLWGLPVLFIIENNGVAVTTPLSHVSPTENLISRTTPFNIYRQQVNGQDIDEVFNATKRAIAVIKNQPAIIECKTMRFKEHQEGKAYEAMKRTNYRDNKEVDYWIANRDPIKLYSDKLIKNGFSRDKIKDIYSEESDLIDDAVEFALKA